MDIVEFKEADKTPLVLVLENIRSLHNIGSVFRTADAFLLEKIYLCGITATPPHKDIRKTALGATESVAREYRNDTLALHEGTKKKTITVWLWNRQLGPPSSIHFFPLPKNHMYLSLVMR